MLRPAPTRRRPRCWTTGSVRWGWWEATITWCTHSTTAAAAAARCCSASAPLPIAALYAVSTALEQLGVRLHLHGDSMPRHGGRTPTLESALELLAPVQLLQTPSTAIRGILPFHDFSHGPDWWTLDDYMFTMEQLAKMKMSFFGLHTYQQVGDPENPGRWGNWTEPAVWTGLKEDVNPDGSELQSKCQLHFEISIENAESMENCP